MLPPLHPSICPSTRPPTCLSIHLSSTDPLTNSSVSPPLIHQISLSEFWQFSQSVFLLQLASASSRYAVLLTVPFPLALLAILITIVKLQSHDTFSNCDWLSGSKLSSQRSTQRTILGSTKAFLRTRCPDCKDIHRYCVSTIVAPHLPALLITTASNQSYEFTYLCTEVYPCRACWRKSYPPGNRWHSSAGTRWRQAHSLHWSNKVPAYRHICLPRIHTCAQECSSTSTMLVYQLLIFLNYFSLLVRKDRFAVCKSSGHSLLAVKANLT